MHNLVLCSFGLFALGCSGDQFVAMTDGVNKPPDAGTDASSPVSDAGFDVIGPKQDSGNVGPFCMGQNPTAIFCADWDKSTQEGDAYLGGVATQMSMSVQPGGSLGVSSMISVSPQNSLRAWFVNSGGGTQAFVFKDGFPPSLQAVHLSFSFRLGPLSVNTIELGAIVVYFSDTNLDFPITIQVSNGKDVHVIAPALLGAGVCPMGIVSDLNAWHRAEVWLDRTRAKVGCKLDQLQSGYAPGSFVLPDGLKAFGLQVGEISIAQGVTGELNIDNLLVDANPPP